MDALLIALLGCLLAELGSKSQRLVLALSARFRRDRALLAGAFAATAANAMIGAAAGAFLAPMLGSNARLLFLAVALLFLGFGLLWPVKPPDPLDSWRTGPFLTSALGLFILGFGEGSQFLILAIAVRTGDPATAALGGILGVMAALAAAVPLRERVVSALPVRVIRLCAGILILIVSLIAAVSALRLI